MDQGVGVWRVCVWIREWVSGVGVWRESGSESGSGCVEWEWERVGVGVDQGEGVRGECVWRESGGGSASPARGRAGEPGSSTLLHSNDLQQTSAQGGGSQYRAKEMQRPTSPSHPPPPQKKASQCTHKTQKAYARAANQSCQHTHTQHKRLAPEQPTSTASTHLTRTPYLAARLGRATVHPHAWGAPA